MKWIAFCTVGVLVVSWYPEGLSEQQGRSWNDMIPMLLDIADKYALKVCFLFYCFRFRCKAFQSIYILSKSFSS